MRKRKLKQSPAKRLLAAILIAIALYGVFGFARGTWRIWRLNRLKQTEEQAIKEANEDIRALQMEIERLQTDSLYIEELARTRYGMIKEGEEVFRIVLPDTSIHGSD